MKIKEFQQLMHQLYYSNDSQRGIMRTTLWLGEEVGELMSELKTRPEDYNKEAIAEEMADIYAWVASLANLLNIDLEQAVHQKYDPQIGCPRCKQNPCNCNKNLP